MLYVKCGLGFAYPVSALLTSCAAPSRVAGFRISIKILLSVFVLFFWAFNWLFFTQKPTKPTENTRIMLGSVTSVCLEGAYAHYHPEVVDILFWAVLLEW